MGRLSSEVFCLSQYVIAKSCADSQFYEVGPGSSKLLSSNFSCPYGIKQNNFCIICTIFCVKARTF